jgi:aspartyl-tRNA(Asn)/glutamyl-tRNA(Gln) amidotransferase subunit C
MATTSDIKKLARISRISLHDNEIDTVAQNINEALGYINIINQSDDLNHIFKIIPQHNLTHIMRSDVAINKNIADVLFEQSPSVEQRLFVIPSLIERS